MRQRHAKNRRSGSGSVQSKRARILTPAQKQADKLGRKHSKTSRVTREEYSRKMYGSAVNKTTAQQYIKPATLIDNEMKKQIAQRYEPTRFKADKARGDLIPTAYRDKKTGRFVKLEKVKRWIRDTRKREENKYLARAYHIDSKRSRKMDPQIRRELLRWSEITT